MKRFYRNTFSTMLLAGGLTMAFSANAQTQLTEFTFTGAAGDEVTYAPDFQPANGNVTDMSRGSGVIPSGSANRFSSSDWALASTGTTLDVTKYYSFTITPDTGFEMDLDSLYFDERRSGTGIRDWAVRSSLDGFATDIATMNVPDDTDTRTSAIGLSAAFEDLTVPVEFRIYGYNSEAIGGTWRIDDVSLIGDISSAGSATTVAFNSNTLSVDETAGTANVLISIANPDPDNATSVDVVVTGGTATAGTDYTYTTQTITFVAGSSASQTVTINITNDTDIEPNETIILELQNQSAGVVLGNSTFTVTIMDDDTPPPVIPLYTIASVTTNDANGIADSLGVEMKLRGIGHGLNTRTSGYQFALIDNTGGINIFRSSNLTGFTYNEGDSLEVTGTIEQYNGLTQLVATNLEVLTVGNPLFAPADVTTLDESTESEIIRIANPVHLVDPSAWNSDPTASSFNIEVTDGTNTYQMRVLNTTDIIGTQAPVGNFYLTGIGGQFDGSAPHDGGYQIAPRYLTDIDMIVGIAEEVKIGSLSVYPNPANQAVTINFGAATTTTTQVMVVNSLGQVVLTKTVGAGVSSDRLEIATLPAGLYVVKMNNATAAKTGTIVKF